MCKLAAVGQMIHIYDEIICSIHQGGHPASHHDPPVGGPWWGSFAKTTGYISTICMANAVYRRIFDDVLVATSAEKPIRRDVFVLYYGENTSDVLM